LESILKKKGDQDDPFVYNALAKALYCMGKSSKNIEILKTAQGYLAKAKEMFPDDLSSLFNWALVEQWYALLLTEQPLEKRSLVSMKEAIPRVEATKEYVYYV
jgi:hypothetical protein